MICLFPFLLFKPFLFFKIDYARLPPMKRKRIVLIVLAFSLFCISNLHAAEIAPTGTPARKLQRGFLNVALSPLEISNELAREKKVDAFIPTWFTGFGRGSVLMVGRALVGVYDMVTAPVPFPAGYEPVISPEFPWEHLEENPKP